MTRRKIALLASCAILLCIYIVQVALSSRNKTLTVSTDDSAADKITITRDGGDTVLSKESGDWVVGDKKYPASASSVDNMLSTLKSISVLEKVGKIKKESEERYELDKSKAIGVTAFSEGKVLRKITIGKSAAASSQTYITLDDKDDICLVSGKMRDVFDKSVDDLRSRLIYKVDENKMNKVSVEYEGKVLSYKRDSSGVEWIPIEGTPECDSEKVSNWAKSLYSLSASNWMDSNFALPNESIAKALIEGEGEEVTVEIYKEDNGEEDKYYCKTSSSPYIASLSSYAALKYMKTASDFEK